MTKVLITLSNDTRLEITRREEAVADGDAAVFDEHAIEIADGIINYLCNAQAAEHRATEALALWMKKHRPALLEEFQLTRFLPPELQ